MPTIHYDKIENALKNGLSAEALLLTAEALRHNSDDAHLWFLRGKALWKAGQKGEAITAYERSAALDPTGNAVIALKMASDVMNYFNPDLLNP